MTSKDRIIKAIGHEKIDRIPVFEQAVASSVASKISGRNIFVGGTAFIMKNHRRRDK